MSHIPVLLNECIEYLTIKKGGVYVDCTVNRGGHAEVIAKKIGKEGTLIIIDLDNDALISATTRVRAIDDGPIIVPCLSNFRHIYSLLEERGIKKVDGILADLGLSSEELDDSGRGFTFRYDEPLLMTYASSVSDDDITASYIVNNWKEESIAQILYGYADEKYSRRIARRIVEYREHAHIATTFELKSIIESAVPFLYRHGKTHCATKTFQALRMAVNDELGAIEEMMAGASSLLNDGGRLCVITFHSTEDRLVKNLMRNNIVFEMVQRKAIMPSDEEIKNNTRSRSAQLRVAQKIAKK